MQTCSAHPFPGIHQVHKGGWEGKNPLGSCSASRESGLETGTKGITDGRPSISGAEAVERGTLEERLGGIKSGKQQRRCRRWSRRPLGYTGAGPDEDRHSGQGTAASWAFIEREREREREKNMASFKEEEQRIGARTEWNRGRRRRRQQQGLEPGERKERRKTGWTEVLLLACQSRALLQGRGGGKCAALHRACDSASNCT